jgi:hypothetical protein
MGYTSMGHASLKQKKIIIIDWTGMCTREEKQLCSVVEPEPQLCAGAGAGIVKFQLPGQTKVVDKNYSPY